MAEGRPGGPPAVLVAGMGASRGVPADEAERLLRGALREAGPGAGPLVAVATADVRADEEGLLECARRFGVPLVTHPVAALAAVPVPTPSEAVRRAVGTPGVAEAAALLGTDGVPGELLVRKRASAAATVAIARHPSRGRPAGSATPPDDPRAGGRTCGHDQVHDQVHGHGRDHDPGRTCGHDHDHSNDRPPAAGPDR